MELTGHEPRRSDLARGIVIARSTRPLDEAAQRAMWDILAAAGVIEKDEDEGDRDSDASATRATEARIWHAAPWIPPTPDELDIQRAALEQVSQVHDLEAIWCVKVETGIDGIAWMEMAEVEAVHEPEADEREVVDAIFEENAEVLYSAPDASLTIRASQLSREQAGEDDDDADELEGLEDLEDASSDDAGEDVPDEDDDDEDDDDEDDDDEDDDGPGIVTALEIESHWRNGAPPFEDSVAFPIERYPDMIEDYDWDRFGVALKLGGPRLPGEESVINAFFALWLSVYQDERADEFEPFQRADVIHDRKHRSALMWVERFTVPATASDQVHFLLWILARIHDVVTIAWARFEAVDDAVKARADTDEDVDPFVLAGNPFADRFRRHGEEAALAWAVSQSAWSKRELAGMLVEVALEHDPDDPDTAPVAERLLRRALAFDAASDAAGYLAIVLVRQRRLAEAVAHARDAAREDVRILVVGEAAEHAPGELGDALELLDPETLDATDPEELADLASTVARHAPAFLRALLAKLPDDGALVPYLYNASFAVERPQALAMLQRVLTLPEPAQGAGEARTALVMAWNNACIHAHALGDFELAVQLADGGQPYAPENPYIYHSAACAYAAVGQLDRALAQVAKAIDHNYEHVEKMETDADLSPLLADARFTSLFTEWRNRRADLN